MADMAKHAQILHIGMNVIDDMVCLNFNTYDVVFEIPMFNEINIDMESLIENVYAAAEVLNSTKQ